MDAAGLGRLKAPEGELAGTVEARGWRALREAGWEGAGAASREFILPFFRTHIDRGDDEDRDLYTDARC